MKRRDGQKVAGDEMMHQELPTSGQRVCRICTVRSGEEEAKAMRALHG